MENINKKEFVLGFAFNNTADKCLLIEKNRPVLLKGTFNGIGGKVEKGEDCFQAMKREFQEETSIHTEEIDWHHFNTLNLYEDNGFHLIIYCFKSFTDKVFKAKTVTDENVKLFNINDLNSIKLTPYVNFLIPMALEGELQSSSMELYVNF